MFTSIYDKLPVSTRILMANASPVLGQDGKYRGVLVSFHLPQVISRHQAIARSRARMPS